MVSGDSMDYKSTWPPASICVMDLSMVSSDSTEHGHQHGLCCCTGSGFHHNPQQHRPRSRSCPEMAMQAPHTNMPPHLGGPRPQTSTWLQAAAQITDIHMAFDGNTGHRHQHTPQLQLDHGSRHGPQQHMDQDINMASG